MEWASWGGEEEEGKAALSKDGAGKGNWSRAGEGRDGPADEAGAPARSETCQDLGRGQTGTEERQQPGQRHRHKEKPREQKLRWDGRESRFDGAGKTGEEKEASSAAEISRYRVN